MSSSAKNIDNWYHLSCQNKSNTKKLGMFGNCLNVKTQQLITNLENENYLKDMYMRLFAQKRHPQ